MTYQRRTYDEIARSQAASQRHKDDVEHIPLRPQEKAAELSAETDELLDEIDAVLEENAQEFVDSFVQQTGE